LIIILTENRNISLEKLNNFFLKNFDLIEIWGSSCESESDDIEFEKGLANTEKGVTWRQKTKEENNKKKTYWYGNKVYNYLKVC